MTDKIKLEKVAEAIKQYTDGLQKIKLLSVVPYLSEEEKKRLINLDSGIYNDYTYPDFVLLRAQVKLLKELVRGGTSKNIKK